MAIVQWICEKTIHRWLGFCVPLGDQLLPLRLRVAREAELGVDLVDVLLYAAVREEEPARDLAVGQARGR